MFSHSGSLDVIIIYELYSVVWAQAQKEYTGSSNCYISQRLNIERVHVFGDLLPRGAALGWLPSRSPICLLCRWWHSHYTVITVINDFEPNFLFLHTKQWLCISFSPATITVTITCSTFDSALQCFNLHQQSFDKVSVHLYSRCTLTIWYWVG